MNGSIPQRSPGTWQLTVDLCRDASARRRKWLTVRGTKAQARRRLRGPLPTHKHPATDADRAVMVGKCLTSVTAAKKEIEVLVDIAG